MRPIMTAGIFIFFIIIFFISGCGTAYNDGKVPLTTSSEKAKEEYIKGRALSEKLRGQESLQYFDNAIKEDPDFAMAYLTRSFFQTGAKEFFEDLNKAVSLADNVTEGEKLQILGAKAGNDANSAKQEEYYKKLVSLFPKDERALTLLANFYFGQQDDAKAIELYNKITEINPEFSPVLNQLGYAQRNLNNYDEAEKAFKKYTELIPDDPNPYDSYAELLLKMGRYDESITYYKKALEINEYFVPSRVGLSANYMYKGDYQESRKQLQTMYDKARDDGERRAALFNMAVIYVDEGNPDAAIKEFEKQIVIDEKNKDYANISADIITIAIVLFESGKYDEALAKYREAADVFDKSVSSQESKDNGRLVLLYNESRIALMKGDIKTADEISAKFMSGVKALNNLNQIKLAHELAGIIAIYKKDADKAIAELTLSNLQNPHNLYRMAAAYKIKGDLDKAREYCEKTINFNALPGLNGAYSRVKAKEMIMSL